MSLTVQKLRVALAQHRMNIEQQKLAIMEMEERKKQCIVNIEASIKAAEEAELNLKAAEAERGNVNG